MNKSNLIKSFAAIALLVLGGISASASNRVAPWTDAEGRVWVKYSGGTYGGWDLCPISWNAGGYGISDPLFRQYLVKMGIAYVVTEGNTDQTWRKATLADINASGTVTPNPGTFVVVFRRDMEKITDINDISGIHNFENVVGNHTESYTAVPLVSNLPKLSEYGSETPMSNGKTQFTGITNLKGLAYFPNLKKFDFSRAKFGENTATYGARSGCATIDLSHNTQLEWVDLNFNSASSVIGLDKSPNLKFLKLCNNELKSLDITANTKLERLQISHNFDLTQIISNTNTNLKELAIFDSMYGWNSNYSLQSLINKFPNLVFLHAYSVNADDIDLTGHQYLQSVWLHNSIWGTRQKSKGNWLHKLDLSNNSELRDIHVHNMHLASLNVASSHLNEPYTSEYSNWKLCIETNGHPTVATENNYRTINADLTKWYKEDANGNRKYYAMYYLRTQDNSGTGGEPMLSDKTGTYKIWSYDSYVGDNNSANTSSQKDKFLTSTLADDLFDNSKVGEWTTATATNSLASSGVMTHTENSAKLMTIEENGGVVTVKNGSLPESVAKGHVNGKIVVLKIFESNAPLSGTPSDVPESVAYTYNIVSGSGAPVYSTFFFDVVYPALGDSFVTAVDDIDSTKQVQSVNYYNVAGQHSMTPFSGVNIVKVTYTDGTSSTTKVIK